MRENQKTDRLVRIVKIINTVGHIFNALGIRLGESKVDGIITKAKRAAKADRIFDDSFRKPLEVLVRSLNEQPSLSTMGRMALRNILIERVSNRLKIDSFLDAHPDCLEAPIDRPVVIAALPRTGTTILHRLFARDPALRIPLHWEMNFPCPPPEKETYETDPRIRKVKKMQSVLDRLAPEIKMIHEHGAQLPEECIFLFANDLISDFFGILADLPIYRKWLDGQDLHFVYQRHKKQLQILQYRYRGERWVLKAPSHLRSIASLIKVYPDAMIIQTHRNPADIIASTSSLFYAYWSVFHKSIDPQKVGPLVLDMIGTYINQSMVDRDHEEKDPNSAVRFIDVSYKDMVARPIDTLRGIYGQCDLSWSTDLERHLTHFLDKNKQAKFGKHSYTLEQYGLKTDQVQERFALYNARFIQG